MKLTSMNISDYRENDFKHPESGVKHTRWELVFEVDNEWFDDTCDEDESNCRYDIAKLYATSYFTGSQTPEAALQDIKNSLLQTYKAWCEGQNILIDNICIDKPGEIDCEVAAKFIKAFYPDRTSFTLDEMNVLDDYRYIFYSTATLIHKFFFDANSGYSLCTKPEELLKWLES